MGLHDLMDRAKLAAELAELIEQRDLLATCIFPIEPHWSGRKNVSVEWFEELEIEIGALSQVIAEVDPVRAQA